MDAKYGGKKPIVSSGDKTKLNVEMTDVSTEASRPVETTVNLTSVCGKQDKHACTIWCKNKTNMLVPYGVKVFWLYQGT